MEPSEDTDQRTTDAPVASTDRASQDHHAGLWSGLVQRTDTLTSTARAGHDDPHAQHVLVEYLHGDVLAHLQTEERVLYAAARSVGAHALVATLEADHRFLLSLVDQIEKADTALEAALSARALVVLFALRVEKEEAIVLPALTDAGVDVTALLEDMIVHMAVDYDARFTYV